MAKIKSAVKYIFAENEDFSLENRLLLSAIIVGTLMSIVGSIMNLFLTTSIIAIVVPLVLSGMMVVIYFLVRFKKMVEPLKIPIVVIALIGISIIWLFKGGIDGSNVMPGFVILILGLIVFPDKLKKYVVLLFITLNIAIYLIQFYRPDYIVNYTSQSERWIDSLFTLIYTSFFIFLIIKFVHKQYTLERINSVENENKYRELVENSPDAIIIYADGIIIYSNKECLRLIAAGKNSELIGRPVIPFVHPDSKELVRERMKTVVKERANLHLTEVRLIRLDGSEVEVEIKAMPIILENKSAVQCIIRDITARKKAEEALHNERLLLRTLIDNIPDSMYSKDLACCKTLANKADVIYSGAKSEADLLGKDDFAFYPKEMAEKYFADDQDVIKTGQTMLNREGHFFDENGQKRYLLSSKLPLHDKDGQIIGLVGIGRDITERKLSEIALQESEALYRNLVEKLPDGIYKSTHEGRFVEVNPAMAKMLGYESKEELMAIDIKTQLYFEPSIRDNIEVPEKLVKTGVYRMKKKDGSEIWVEDHGWFNFDENSNILYHEGIMRDVTERKVAELALQESEALYRNLVERLPDGVYKSTHEGQFVDGNPALIKMLGFTSKEELMSIDIKTQLYFEPEDRESLELQEKFEEMGIYRLRKKDGSTLWVEDHGWYNVDEKGNILFHEGIMRDITDRKQSDEALRKSEEQHRTILQTALDGYWLMNRHGRLLEVNEAYCKMSGYTAPELLTMYISDLEANKAADKASNLMLQIEAEGESRYETRHRRKDGSIFDIEASAKYQHEEGWFVVFMHDITDRKKREKELIQAKEKAEESERLKSAFLANMSHEIRTPMNGILGFADLLKAQDLSGEEQQEYIGIIKKSGDRMLNIINDIIDISKIESGQMNVSVSETKINEQTEFIYNFFKPETEKKGIQLISVNGMTDEEAIINTDKEKVYAILTNLVKNAIKFTIKGSIEFGYLKKGKYLEFYVKDTGFGIPDDRQQAIFDRFVQADIADSRAFQGAGLGLSISRAYVEMLGGKIWVVSKEGKGSSFYFTIRHNLETEEKSLDTGTNANKMNNQTKKLKILIVEDDESSEILISIAVRMLSREVLKVTTGADAVELCRKNPDIDLVLMDVKMPEMDGYEATQRIRQFNKNVYIIAQTAFGQEEEKEKALDAGCNEYISKPLDVNSLKDIIKSHFDM